MSVTTARTARTARSARNARNGRTVAYYVGSTVLAAIFLFPVVWTAWSSIHGTQATAGGGAASASTTTAGSSTTARASGATSPTA